MRVHHLALRTADVGRLEAFYGRALGLEVIRRDGGRVWLAAGDAIVMLEPRDAGEPDVPEGSMELVAFAASASRIAELEAELAGRGVRVEGRTAYTIYVRDPDGRRVGVSHYADRAAERT